MKGDKLTTKQQRFVDIYDGNATDAARKAGYKGNANTLGQVGDENLKKPKIYKAIQEREQKRNSKDIATREERQKFWTKVMRGDIQDEMLPAMLKGSELLGKSEADFVEKRIIDTGAELSQAVASILHGNNT